MIAVAMGAPPTNENGAWQGSVGGQSEQAQTAVAQLYYPLPTSVKGRVLADLLAGARITHMDVWERHGSSRAAHHVLMLRKAGWPVITNEIDAPTSDGRIARIAEYSLPIETIEKAGDQGRKFVAKALAARRGL